MAIAGHLERTVSMGFYNNNETSEEKPLKQNRSWRRWAGVVVLSALVGSASTTAIIKAVAAPEAMTASAIAVVSDSPTTPSILPAAVKVSDGITRAVKQVEPAVMGVVNYARISDFFSEQTKLQANGVGTGVLVYKDDSYGYLVTNNHVVQGAAKVETVMTSGKHVKATVVGTDPYTDLAVLKIAVSYVKGIHPAEFANSNDIEAGEPAIAIGTPMGLDFADSVTAGIVSAKQRTMPVEVPDTQDILDYQSVIQTDAAINPGNSGGPLLNIKGQVIGINSSKIAAPNFEGMGFAIPSNEVRAIANQIMKTGHAVHPALGIAGQSLVQIPEQFWPDVPVDYGVWIQRVTQAASQSGGLQSQDVIVGIDGHEVRTMADLRTYLFQMKPGQVVTLRVYHGKQIENLKVKLGEAQGVNTTDMNLGGQLTKEGQPSTSSGGNMDPFGSPFGN